MASTSTVPRVRGACQLCHRRKIRCILPHGDSACQNCALVGSECLFAPRGKPGRVPARKSDGDDVLATTTPPFSYDPNQHPPHVQYALPEQLLTPTPRSSLGYGVNLPSGESDAPLDTAWSRQDTMQASHSSLGYFTQWPDMCQVNTHLLSPQPSIRHMAMTDEPARSSAANVLTDYASILDTCRRMHEYCQRAPSNTESIDHDLLDTMAKLCTAAATQAQDLPRRAASTATLVTSALLKVLEVSEATVARLTDRSSMVPRGRVEDLFMLKQLDLMLLQSKVYFSQDDQYGGAQRATELHQAITPLVERDFSSWSWYD